MEESTLVLDDSTERLSRIRFLIVVAFAVLLDQATKIFVVERFSLGESLSIIPGLFNLTYIRNPGIAFGLFPAKAGWGYTFLLAMPLVVVSLIIFWYSRLSRKEKWEGLALSLIVGGALSNVADRFRMGSVVDFLDFHWQGKAHYPAFNAADIFVCTGVAILFLSSLRKEKAGYV